MDSRPRGKDLLPRIAPIPRSIPGLASPRRTARLCHRAPGLCRRVTQTASRVTAALGRGLTVLPVLELVGIGLLILLLGR